MRRLHPEPAAGVDPYDAYGEPPGLRLGMVMSADGSVTDAEGWTDGLGGEADFRVFRTLRALADAILVGAGTVRTGRLGPARLRPDLRARRGGPPAPIVVVSRSLDLDWSLPLFTEAETPTVVVTTERARARVPSGVTAVAAGEDEVDLPAAVRALREDLGHERLLCEGGPALATALLRASLVDELCLNLAPTLLGGPRHTRLLGGLDAEVPLEPAALYLDEGVLFVRYLVRV
ncbi:MULTISPECIES: dihydrofolate reductase family protein [Actinomadura]|uniref:Deaminase n=1 Tax=Actinomadura litoris TaxID=2678616 RepID=A0A7K1KVT4_9ACTN|nr:MULTISPECIES: dihydrofolate reductase family protein [Actinomadura]MBT2211385.1 dihydrofolate reductase family protein [Actinomadura sp. NEAU-AAG7]MUN36301.1 deaminase [Actinomadura litoris]